MVSRQDFCLSLYMGTQYPSNYKGLLNHAADGRRGSRGSFSPYWAPSKNEIGSVREAQLTKHLQGEEVRAQAGRQVVQAGALVKRKPG